MSTNWNSLAPTPAASLAATDRIGLNDENNPPLFKVVALSDLATYVQTLSSGAALVGTAASGATEGSIRVSSGLTGSGSVEGGTRGAAAVDLQIARTYAANVASGNYSFLGGGQDNQTLGAYSAVIGGQENIASGDGSIVAGGASNTASGEGSHVSGGFAAKTTLYGQRAAASGNFSVRGDCQAFDLICRRTTVNATPANLFLNGTSLRLSLASEYAWAFTVNIFGINDDGAKAGHYIRKGMIANVGGTTALIGSVTTVGTDTETDAGLDVAVTADNTNDALDIQVTGLLATAMRWICRVDGLQLKY